MMDYNKKYDPQDFVVCPQCGKFDTARLSKRDDTVWFDCVNCGAYAPAPKLPKVIEWELD